MENYAINYNERMLNYYPEIIKSVREFQALINSQSIQVEDMHTELTKILSNNYISTADEQRISEWEKFLGINPLPQGSDDLDTWLNDRREVIIARLYSVPKLNSKSISDIVNIFTKGTAKSYFKDGVVHILINPPKDNKQFKFKNVEQELSKKIPAHLSFKIDRTYYTWLEVYTNGTSTWEDIALNYFTWNDVVFNDLQ